MTNESPITALIADDVALMRDLLKDTLSKLGVEVTAVATNGTEAGDMLVTLKPDMAFLDIEMPGATGLEVLDKVKQNNIDTFCVMVSGQSTFDNLKTAIDRGAKGFVVKPYTESKISQIIEKFKAGT